MSEASKWRGRVDWTPDMDEVIRRMWQVASTAAIGAEIGVSKGAVIGRAGRLGLGAKPIIIRGKAFPPARRPEPKPREVAPVPEPIGEALEMSKRNQGKGALERTLAIVAAPAAPPAQARAPRACCWPMWPDGERAPRPPISCGQPSEPDRVYCRPHAAIAYVPYKPREIADAA